MLKLDIVNRTKTTVTAVVDLISDVMVNNYSQPFINLQTCICDVFTKMTSEANY